MAGFRREYANNLPLTLCFIPRCYISYWNAVSTRRPHRGIPLTSQRFESERDLWASCRQFVSQIRDSASDNSRMLRFTHSYRRPRPQARGLNVYDGPGTSRASWRARGRRTYEKLRCALVPGRGRPFALAKPQRRTLLLRRVRGMTHVRPLAGLALTYAQPPPTNNQL